MNIAPCLVFQVAVFSPDATFIDRDGGDLERDACKMNTPYYPFHREWESLHVESRLVGGDVIVYLSTKSYEIEANGKM